MLTLKKETDYAIQFLKLLEKNQSKPVSLKKVAEQTGVPFLFLQKIARKLRFGGIIKSEQGAHGGYTLKITPAQLTLKKIVEVMEGGCGLSLCLESSKNCPRHKKKCSLRVSLRKVNKKIVDILQKTKLKQL